MEVQGRVRYCPPSSGDSCHGSFLSAEERPMTALSVLTEEGNYSSFTLAADARMHWGKISRVSSYFSNRYVSTAQTGQVVDRNSNCFTGWWPCNLHTSCCMLTVNNCFIHKTIIVAYNSTPGGISVVGLEEFFIFLAAPFLFLGLFISYAHFICAQMKNHTSTDGSLGHTPLLLLSELLTIKTNGQPRHQMLCWGIGVLLLDVYWNKRKREIERMEQLE